MSRFSGKVCFITGGASGIGLALGRALGMLGARVVLADINAEALAEAAGGFPGEASTFVLDVRDRGQWAEARAHTETCFGPVSVLVNNAGIITEGANSFAGRGLIDRSPESFDRMVAINLTGVYNGIHTFAPGMADRGEGHIVSTSSTQGLITCRGVGAYCATKFAVVALSESLRDELAEFNVGVSVLCPGQVQTPLRTNTNRLAGLDDAPIAKGPGIDPDKVAEMVIAGILANRLYIFTHGEYAQAISERHQRMMAGFVGVPVSDSYQSGDPIVGTPEYAALAVERMREQGSNFQ